MKKTIIIFLLLSIYSLAQENRLIRQNDLTDSLNAIRTLIGTGGIALPDSVLFSSDSTDQRTFSDAKYVDKTTAQTITGQKDFSNTKTVFNVDSVIVKKKLIVDYALSPYKLTLATNSITQYSSSGGIIRNSFQNDLGLSYFGIEGSAGGSILSTSSPYSFVLHNYNGYPIHFGVGSFIHQTIDGLNGKTTFYSDSVALRGKLNVDGTVKIGEYTLPNTDGSAGQLQKTDGNGNLYWTNDLSLSGVGTFNLDYTYLDTNITGEATFSEAVKDSIRQSMNLYRGVNSWADYSASNVFRLGKSYADRRYNNGAYSDVWIIDYVIPPYNLSATWLYPIEHRTDYYNDTLQTVAHSDILKIDGTGTPIWRTNDVRIMGNEIQVDVGDLPDSTILDWSLAGLTGNKVILSEANKTASASRFPMPVRGYEFKFGSTPYYTYPYVYGFYSDLTTNTPDLETAYHFYGKGNFPSYFGGDIILNDAGLGNVNIEVTGSIGGNAGIRTGETVQVVGDSPSFGFVKDANISDLVPPSSMTGSWDWVLPNKSGTIALLGDIGTSGTDSATVKSLALAEITTKFDTMQTETSTYTMNEVDSILTLAQTLINALRGGTTGQALTKNSDADFDFVWANIGTVDLSDNTPPLPPSSFVAIGGTATDEFVSTWTDPTASDLDSIRFYAGSSNDSTALVWVENIIPGAQTYTYRSLTAGTTYWAAVKAVDDSGNVSWFSPIDSATTLGGGSPAYTSGASYVWNHLTEANNTILTSWEDSTANLAIYSNGEGIYTPTNVDSGVVWTAYDQYLRQAASFPAGLFDGALTIEMVVKVARIDSSQCLFQARNASNIAMGIGIGATGIFVGNAYDATGGEDYTHNSTATTGWHHLVYTWNGTTTTAFYVDGNLVSDTGDLNQYDAISGDNRMSMGKTGATNFPICSGTLTPYIAVYKSALNSTQVSNNYNSTVIQNQIPAWAR